ncbi:hypothetical protein Bbelb_080310 [Branchiostoma belcheri]|nr:hypothetical protein Bbelb_080310 [Branchiostoma belcheri]
MPPTALNLWIVLLRTTRHVQRQVTRASNTSDSDKARACVPHGPRCPVPPTGFVYRPVSAPSVCSAETPVALYPKALYSGPVPPPPPPLLPIGVTQRTVTASSLSRWAQISDKGP